MSETQMVILGCILAYFALMIWIGYRQSKVQDHHGFVIGGRDVGFIPTLGSLAAGARDGAGIVMWIGFAYTVGYGALWAFVGIFFGYLVFSIIGPKARELSMEKSYITIGQMLREKIGKSSDRVSALVIAIFALLAMALQLHVSGNLFATIIGQPAWMGLIAVGVIVCFYLFEGGYGSVVKTDTIQFFVILALIFIPLFMDVKKEDVMAVETIVSMGWKDSIALFIIGFLVAISFADNWQRVFSAKNDTVIRWGFPMAGPALIIMTLALIFIGYGLKDIVSADQKDDVLFILFNKELLDTWLLAYIGVVVMAITMSTLDTQTYLFTSTILKNFVPKDYTKDRDQYIKLSRIIIVLAMVVMGLIALAISDIVQFLFQTYSLMYILGPVFVFTAFGWFKSNKGTDLYITANILVCGAVYIFMFMSGMLEDMLMTTVPAGISLVGCIVGSFLSHKVFDNEPAVH